MASLAEEDWPDINEAQQKLLAARRERSDRISKAMSEYLLKGYRMLASTCSACDTIELQDRQGQMLCVACSEVDCDDNLKDSVALNPQASRLLMAEQEQRLQRPTSATVNLGSNVDQMQKASSSSSSSSHSQEYTQVVDQATVAVLAKLKMAAHSLSAADSWDSCRSTIATIKECAECLASLKGLAP